MVKQKIRTHYSPALQFALHCRVAAVAAMPVSTPGLHPLSLLMMLHSTRVSPVRRRMLATDAGHLLCALL